MQCQQFFAQLILLAVIHAAPIAKPEAAPSFHDKQTNSEIVEDLLSKLRRAVEELGCFKNEDVEWPPSGGPASPNFSLTPVQNTLLFFLVLESPLPIKSPCTFYLALEKRVQELFPTTTTKATSSEEFTSTQNKFENQNVIEVDSDQTVLEPERFENAAGGLGGERTGVKGDNDLDTATPLDLAEAQIKLEGETPASNFDDGGLDRQSRSSQSLLDQEKHEDAGLFGRKEEVVEDFLPKLRHAFEELGCFKGEDVAWPSDKDKETFPDVPFSFEQTMLLFVLMHLGRPLSTESPCEFYLSLEKLVEELQAEAATLPQETTTSSGTTEESSTQSKFDSQVDSDGGGGGEGTKADLAQMEEQTTPQNKFESQAASNGGGGEGLGEGGKVDLVQMEETIPQNKFENQAASNGGLSEGAKVDLAQMEKTTPESSTQNKYESQVTSDGGGECLDEGTKVDFAQAEEDSTKFDVATQIKPEGDSNFYSDGLDKGSDLAPMEEVNEVESATQIKLSNFVDDSLDEGENLASTEDNNALINDVAKSSAQIELRRETQASNVHDDGLGEGDGVGLTLQIEDSASKNATDLDGATLPLVQTQTKDLKASGTDLAQKESDTSTKFDVGEDNLAQVGNDALNLETTEENQTSYQILKDVVSLDKDKSSSEQVENEILKPNVVNLAEENEVLKDLAALEEFPTFTTQMGGDGLKEVADLYECGEETTYNPQHGITRQVAVGEDLGHKDEARNPGLAQSVEEPKPNDNFSKNPKGSSAHSNK